MMTKNKPYVDNGSISRFSSAFRKGNYYFHSSYIMSSLFNFIFQNYPENYIPLSVLFISFALLFTGISGYILRHVVFCFIRTMF